MVVDRAQLHIRPSLTVLYATGMRMRRGRGTFLKKNVRFIATNQKNHVELQKETNGFEPKYFGRGYT